MTVRVDAVYRATVQGRRTHAHFISVRDIYSFKKCVIDSRCKVEGLDEYYTNIQESFYERFDVTFITESGQHHEYKLMWYI